jgi:dTDP-4-amino-4,6-dideoxygalactose transaminase
MPEINAAMGLVNLDALPRFVAANRANHEAYAAAFAKIDGVRLLHYDDTQDPNYQYVVIEVDPAFPASRDRIVAVLQAENILARKYFWPGCHRMQPYRALYPHAGLLLPNTDAVAARVIVLPNGETLDDRHVAVIASVVRALTGEHHE